MSRVSLVRLVPLMLATGGAVACVSGGANGLVGEAVPEPVDVSFDASVKMPPPDFPGFDGGGFDPPSSSSGSGGPISSGCGSYTPPVEGTPCTEAQGLCEYGHDLESACNYLYYCLERWVLREQASCHGRCPEAFEDIVPGSACTGVARGCSYFEGTCACVGDDARAAPDGGTSGQWRCAPPPPSRCPAQRPPLGGECVRPMTCDYGSAVLGMDLSFTCDGVAWGRTDPGADR